jgi:catechol 2,3-dioxygenase-like lactoylglutathione lyase family enzyme
MLGNRDAAANLAVKNLETAKKFYADTLGLTQVGARGPGTGRFQEWKIHNQSLSVAICRDQPGDSRDLDRRRGC